ncbi:PLASMODESMATA CALLOSE-BINDING PROTEIN 3-like [Malania oleifera]|uniref:PLASMODESMATA CALLOSE-BINDING PROTEIN 3-like n=1 Tax=Malania oleifera TaxID=397392 RepID=UPI0025ADA831|nr:PLASMODESMATA CALLOSE-BINDING PROTEIN 3-like [Malania oleifera]
MAAVLFLLLTLLAITGNSRGGSGSGGCWCVCKEGLSDGVLQKTLDYACGAGADCRAIHQNGACFTPNTVKAHCTYAVNSYFQKKAQAPGTCDFSSTAQVVSTDPSSHMGTATTCSYPSSQSAASSGTTATPLTPATPSTGTTPSTTTPGGATPTGTTPNYNATPTSGTGSGGVIGGGMGGTNMGPSGVGINTNTDYSGGLSRMLRYHQGSSSFFFFLISCLVLLPLL